MPVSFSANAFRVGGVVFYGRLVECLLQTEICYRTKRNMQQLAHL